MMSKKLIPILLILTGLAGFFILGGKDYLSFDALKANHQSLVAFYDAYPILMPACFMGIYVLAVALSIPGAIFLTLAAGYLFGPWLGTAIVVVSATIGASLIFMAGRLALSDWIASLGQPWVMKLEHGIRENGCYYLLTLRLIPLVPFWVLNIVPGLLKMPARAFIIATFFGIIPGSAIYASLGAGLSTLFARDEAPHLAVIFEPYILTPLCLLGVMALLPVVVKRGKSNVS